MIKFYWDEKNGMLYRELVIGGKVKVIYASKPVNVEVIELNCMEIDGYYYELIPSKSPLKPLKSIWEEEEV